LEFGEPTTLVQIVDSNVHAGHALLLPPQGAKQHFHSLVFHAIVSQEDKLKHLSGHLKHLSNCFEFIYSNNDSDDDFVTWKFMKLIEWENGVINSKSLGIIDAILSEPEHMLYLVNALSSHEVSPNAM
jgi:hypothetical protein